MAGIGGRVIDGVQPGVAAAEASSVRYVPIDEHRRRAFELDGRLFLDKLDEQEPEAGLPKGLITQRGQRDGEIPQGVVVARVLLPETAQCLAGRLPEAQAHPRITSARRLPVQQPDAAMELLAVIQQHRRPLAPVPVFHPDGRVLPQTDLQLARLQQGVRPFHTAAGQDDTGRGHQHPPAGVLLQHGDGVDNPH